jgi:hypothetical protein
VVRLRVPQTVIKAKCTRISSTANPERRAALMNLPPTQPTITILELTT